MKNKKSIAKELGITRPTLDKYLGLPGAPQPDEQRRYDVGAVAAFIKTHAASVKTSARTSPELTELRARELRAKCERIEYRLGVEKGEYLPKAQTLSFIRQMAQRTKLVLQAKLERELPPKLVGLDVYQIIERMEQTVTEVCETMRDSGQYKFTTLVCEKCGHQSSTIEHRAAKGEGSL